MSIKNHIRIIGNLGNNAEVKTFESGKSVINFSLAESYKKKDDSEVTRWHDCKLWAKKELADMFTKGREVTIAGELDYEHYTSKEGTKVKKPVILVDEFKVTTGAKKEEE